MARREPKTRHTTTIEVVGRTGDRKGWIELGAGNIVYYRVSAKKPTLDLTYLQLFSLFEKEIEFMGINENNIKLPPDHPSGDFILIVNEVNDTEDNIFSSYSSIKKLDPKRIDLGSYQFSDDMASGRKLKKYSWYAEVSIQAALWIVHRYIDKFLVQKKSTTYTDEDILISKNMMRKILISFYKKIS